jgi:hypothetical protein
MTDRKEKKQTKIRKILLNIYIYFWFLFWYNVCCTNFTWSRYSCLLFWQIYRWYLFINNMHINVFLDKQITNKMKWKYSKDLLWSSYCHYLKEKISIDLIQFLSALDRLIWVVIAYKKKIVILIGLFLFSISMHFVFSPRQMTSISICPLDILSWK